MKAFKYTFFAFVLFMIVSVVLGFYSEARAPKRFKQEWIEKFQTYTATGEIPSEWRNDVYLRKLTSGEWVLAAMHHGVCAPGPRGIFNASVIRDSNGRISTLDWSPCSDHIPENIGGFWEELVPADTLAELYTKQKWEAAFAR